MIAGTDASVGSIGLDAGAPLVNVATTLPLDLATALPLDLATALPLSSAETVGGSPAVVALVFLSLVLATALSLYLAVRLYRGYRAGGQRGMLALGVGLVLLTTVPMVLRLGLSNVAAVETTWQEVLATACQLLGLLVILGVIHGRR